MPPPEPEDAVAELGVENLAVGVIEWDALRPPEKFMRARRRGRGMVGPTR